MRWLRMRRPQGAAYGIVEGDEVVEVEGDPFSGHAATARRHPLAGIEYLPPVVPPTLYAAGLNYAEHIREIALQAGEKPKLPTAADIGYRGPSALTGHEQPVIIPADASERIQYEAELVVVIGRRARNLSEAEALTCVLGYTIGNDVSERGWQASDRTLWRAKSCDTFMPMGPWIETDLDLDAAETIVRINGRETLRFRTNSMLFGVPAFISRMSTYMTLHPGDVIWMGTEGASENIADGDRVEVEITGIGVLANRFEREKASPAA